MRYTYRKASYRVALTILSVVGWFIPQKTLLAQLVDRSGMTWVVSKMILSFTTPYITDT